MSPPTVTPNVGFGHEDETAIAVLEAVVVTVFY